MVTHKTFVPSLLIDLVFGFFFFLTDKVSVRLQSCRQLDLLRLRQQQLLPQSSQFVTSDAVL